MLTEEHKLNKKYIQQCLNNSILCYWGNLEWLKSNT